MAPNRRRTVAQLLRAVGFALVLCFLSIGERALTAFILVLLFIIYVRSSVDFPLPLSCLRCLPNSIQLVLPDCSPAGFLSCLPFGL